MQYIKRIDGLRGIAVLAVLLYHLDIPLFRGGLIGVDIFFVISGFLITGSIQTSLSKSSFSIIDFYKRRIRRLLPALYLMLFVVSVVSFFIFLPHTIKATYQAIAATVVYLSNVFFYQKTDYFNPAVLRSPLIHTWSLSVEEQFYLVYPFILVFLRKASDRKRLIVLVTLSIISFAASVYYFHIDKLYTFYYPWFRGWELGLGGIVFLCTNQKKIGPDKIPESLNMAYYLSLIVILSSFIFCRADQYIPGLGSLPAVLACCIILSFNKVQNLSFDPLQQKSIVFIGAISYSLYLWHQPVFSILLSEDGPGTWSGNILAVSISFVLAIVSWKFVERPFTRLSIRNHKLWTTTITTSVLLLAIGISGHYTDGFINFFTNKMPKDRTGWFIKFDEVLSKRKAVWKTVLKSNDDKKNLANLDFLIVGDSKGEDMTSSFTLNDSIRTRYTFYYLRLKSEDMGEVANYLSQNKDGDLAERKSGSAHSFSSYEIFSKIDSLQVKNIIFTCTWSDKTNKGASKLIRALSTHVKKTFVVSTANWNDMVSLSMRLARSDMNDRDINKFLYKNMREDFKRQSDNLHTLIKNDPNIIWLDKENAFCSADSGDCYLYSKEKEAYIYDTGHFSVAGAKYFGDFIAANHWFGLFTDSVSSK